MLIDTSSERLNMSASSIPSKDDFTVSMLKDQLKFLGSKIQQATQEIEEKERVIQKLEHEKREFQRRFEHVELENFQMQELMAQSASQPADCLMTGADNGFKTPSLSKQQNKRVLEADGIQCFDLEKQSENGNDDFLLRMSIGPLFSLLVLRELIHKYLVIEPEFLNSLALRHLLALLVPQALQLSLVLIDLPLSFFHIVLQL